MKYIHILYFLAAFYCGGVAAQGVEHPIQSTQVDISDVYAKKTFVDSLIQASAPIITDTSATNELQMLSISIDTIKLSNGGGSVVLPFVQGESTTVSSTATISHTLSGFEIKSDINNGSVTPAMLDRVYLESELDGDPNNENQTVVSGSGINVTQAGQTFTILNTAPDQVVSISGTGITTVSGVYPNFTANTPSYNGIYPISVSGSNISHSTSTVVAGTYGSQTQIPVFSVNSLGHVTNAVNATLVLPKINAVTLATDFTSNVTSNANVTGLSSSLLAGKTYKIDYIGSHRTTAAGTGIRLNYTYSGTTSFVSGKYEAAISTVANSTPNTRSFALGTTFISTGVNPSNTPHYHGTSIVMIPSSDGVLQLQFASEVAGSTATLIAGSTIIITEL